MQAFSLIRRAGASLPGIIRKHPARFLGTGVAFCALMAGIIFYTATPAPHAPDYAAMPLIPSTDLSESDRTLSESIFRAQARGEFDWADELMAQLNNQILLGHMLAQRYLDTNYKADADELLVWLANYGDHPQAARIKAIAARKGADREQLAAIHLQDTKPLKGDGYIDHLGRSGMPDGWYTGLARWKERAYGPAFTQFQKVAATEKLSDWQRAAAHYWSARAAQKLKRDKDARRELANAATYKTTFYGQLANQQLGNRGALIAAAPYVPNDLRNAPAVQRAAALASVNQRELAEDELRYYIPTLSESERPALLSIAGELGLANLQVRMANNKHLSTEENLYASYPVPPWFVRAQAGVDPALLLAIARQESVFRGEVKSSAGAIGMMQMMPSTARHVVGTLSADAVALASNDTSIPLSQQLDDPSVNIRLGSQYIALLKRQPAVKGDLIRTIAAYNAGPGSVQSWQAASRNISDPLLYIESIPYPETRNYVMQVMAHAWVYQTLMGQEPQGLGAIAAGQWPQA